MPDDNNAIDRSDWVNCSLTVCKEIEILQGSFAMTKILLELLVSIQPELTQKNHNFLWKQTITSMKVIDDVKLKRIFWSCDVLWTSKLFLWIVVYPLLIKYSGVDKVSTIDALNPKLIKYAKKENKKKSVWGVDESIFCVFKSSSIDLSIAFYLFFISPLFFLKKYWIIFRVEFCDDKKKDIFGCLTS